MDVEKQSKFKDQMKDKDDQLLEHLHHNLFDHPNNEEWNATRSLSQPSFLRQVDSYGGAHSQPSESLSSRSEE